MKQTGGFDKKAFKDLFEAESKSFWFQNRNSLIVYYLKKYFPQMNNYLEIGCGTGFVLKAVHDAFPECNICGSELYEEGLVYAQTRVPNAKFIQLDAVNMKEQEKYDCFGAYDVLEHIKDDEMVMKNLYSALIPAKENKYNMGGVITVPQHMFLWSEEDDIACHIRRYSQKELREKITKAGFSVVRMTGFVSLLFPAMMISRLFRKSKRNREKRTSKKGDELHLPFWLNIIFSAVMKIELSLIKLGITFPFGGSILAVVIKKN